MKGEYSNIFFVSVNPQTKETVITFKQATVEPTPNGIGEPNANTPIPTKEELIDISKIILTTENANQLIRLLSDVLSKVNPQENDNNG